MRAREARKGSKGWKGKGNGGVGIVGPVGRVVVAATGLTALWAPPVEAQVTPEDVRVPDGFEVSIAASGLDGVRILKVGPDGALYAVLSRARCGSTTNPALEMQAHSAPLGMVFYEGTSFPEAYHYPAVAPDGSLLVSDDGEGRIWRIRYVGTDAGSE